MVAPQAAPQIDRLVFGVGRRAADIDGDQMDALLEAAGLEAAGWYPGLADLILAGVLTDRVAALRFRYMPDADLASFLEQAREKQLLTSVDGVYRPSEALRALLRFSEERRRTAAAQLWGGYTDEVARLTGLCSEVIDAAGDSPLLDSFAGVPLPGHPEGRLFKLLERMRYLRSDAHAAAWRDAGLTAAEMVELTPIWNGNEPKGEAGPLASLEERGLIEDGALTAQGRSIRDGIEAETNRRARPAFDALGDRADTFVELLVALPDEPA